MSERIIVQWNKFHDEHPEVGDQLTRMALQLLDLGHVRYGMKSLFEVARWHRAIHMPGEEFKLNNNYAPYYARWAMTTHPQLRGFFKIRALQS